MFTSTNTNCQNNYTTNVLQVKLIINYVCLNLNNCITYYSIDINIACYTDVVYPNESMDRFHQKTHQIESLLVLTMKFWRDRWYHCHFCNKIIMLNYYEVMMVVQLLVYVAIPIPNHTPSKRTTFVSC